MFTNNQLISNILHFCLFQKEKWQKHYLQLISKQIQENIYNDFYLYKENPNEKQKHSSSAFGKKQLVITTIFNSRSYFL